MLLAAHAAGRLQFFGDLVPLADKVAFAAFLKPLRKINWVVDVREPFAGPKQVLRYLSRYTHRVAISNRRLISANENGVTFRYKDYRIDGPARYKTMTLAADEFIRRFLIHVLPKRFHRIRHYGLLAKANRATNIARARELLGVPSPAKDPEPTNATDEQRVLPRPCPCCGGRMIIIETFARGCEPKHRPHPLRNRSGSIPHDLFTTYRRPQSQASISLLYHQQHRWSQSCAQFHPARRATPVVNRPTSYHSFAPSPKTCNKPIAAAASRSHLQLSHRG